MVEIQVRHYHKGYRTYITQGHKTTVIDGAFEKENADLKTSRYSTPYQYGT